MKPRKFMQNRRDELGVTQKMVADMVGIAQGTYSNIEKGKKAPSVKLAKKLADILGVTWTAFYE
jgi:DNA-binding XRE family transcriptional regulator|nr:MAG TPA: Helix-turn-helix XRE-family like protein [Bacteriophage sp.]DAU21607.1 MAG TPA: Helix-turn-helix XRE-family like protein [Caudoviricetes sp.]